MEHDEPRGPPLALAALALAGAAVIASRGPPGPTAPGTTSATRPAVRVDDPVVELRRAGIRADGGSRSAAVPDPEPGARVELAPVAIAGVLAGVRVPRTGAAWIVEACRLSPARSAVVERRRTFVEPDTGTFAFADVTPGTWQLAVVAPRFAWGPLVEAGHRERDDVRVPVDVGRGAIHVRDGPPGSRPGPVLAVRSAALRGAAVDLQIPVAVTPEHDGVGWYVGGLPPGEYELAIDGPGRTRVTVGTDPVVVELPEPGAATSPPVKPVPW